MFEPRVANGEHVNGKAVIALPVAQFAVAILRVVAPPRETAPPPARPAPAVKVKDGFASMLLSTLEGAMLRLTAPVVPPPVRPEPATRPVIVPEPPPRGVWPGAKLIVPLAFTLRPVSATAPLEPNRRFIVAEGVSVLFELSTGSACQRKIWFCAAPAELLKTEATLSSALELKACEAVAVPAGGRSTPAAESGPVKLAEAPPNDPVAVRLPAMFWSPEMAIFPVMFWLPVNALSTSSRAKLEAGTPFRLPALAALVADAAVRALSAFTPVKAEPLPEKAVAVTVPLTV